MKCQFSLLSDGTFDTIQIDEKKTQILKNIECEIKQPGIYGLIGHNGSGKTTFFKSLLGLVPHAAGTIQFPEFSIVGYAPEEPALYKHFTAREHLDFFQQLHGATRTSNKTDELLDQVDLTAAAQKRVGTFSKGMRQRLALAISLIGDPTFLIWDEPMDGLDPRGRIRIKKLMDDLRNQGKTILFSTHLLADIAEKADELLLLSEGQLIQRQKILDREINLEGLFQSE